MSTQTGASGSPSDDAGASAAGAGATGKACSQDGALRCAVRSQTTIESCVGGAWSVAEECGADQRCASPSTGEAECTTVEVECDGLLCNDECVPNDEKNCGTCGHDCTGLLNVSGPTTCEAGACAFAASSCEPGFAHCSKDPEDGCETKLSSVENCGGCGVKCPATEPVCAQKPGTDEYECSTGCNEDAPALCGASCVDPMADAAHCGGCNEACPSVANGQPVCMQGACAKKCNSGYHLCGDKCVANNSPASCGTECSPCPTPTGARATCDGKSCGFSCTNTRALKCSDGCYPSDDNNCGSCGNDCGASGKVCDGTRCVECRTNSDCGGSTRYCVNTQCRECQPGNSSTCNSCEECSSQGSCVSAGVSRVCYSDSDGDGYGAKTGPQSVCGSCPSGTLADNSDCNDSNEDVHPGQVNYFETAHRSGSENVAFDYDCNGRAEKQALNPPSRQEIGCACNSSGMCRPTSTPATPCGKRGSQCLGGAGDTCTTCDTIESWVIQGCR